MTAVIIDDGVDCGYYPGIDKLVFDLCVNQRNKVVKRKGKLGNSHGTICAAIVKKYAPKAKIGSIKVISDETGKGNPSHLVTALDWCTQNKIRLVNMSLGSTKIRDFEKIDSAVKRFQDSGGIIISALTNSMNWSIPACLDGVIGVRTDKTLKNDEYKADEKGLYNVSFAASSRHCLENCLNEKIITQCSNSFAAPLITALAYNELSIAPEMTAAELCKKLGGELSVEIETRIANTKLPKEELDIPIISISGGKTNLSAAIELKEQFIKRGYPCAVWSDEKLLGVGWLPHDNAKAILCMHTQKLQLSAVIIISRDTKWSGDIADCWIRIEANRKRNRYTGDTIFISQKYTKGNIRGVVRYLERIDN